MERNMAKEFSTGLTAQSTKASLTTTTFTETAFTNGLMVENTKVNG